MLKDFAPQQAGRVVSGPCRQLELTIKAISLGIATVASSTFPF